MVVNITPPRPLEESDLTSQTWANPTAEPGKPTVLIVEDSPIVRERLVTLIAELGNVVIVDQADVGAQALSLFRLHRPTAVVLDIDLPDLDGLELLVEFKLENPHCIVLMLSTLATDDFIRRRCQALGADYCFDKYMEFERALDVLGRLNIN